MNETTVNVEAAFDAATHVERVLGELGEHLSKQYLEDWNAQDMDDRSEEDKARFEEAWEWPITLGYGVTDVVAGIDRLATAADRAAMALATEMVK